MRLLQLILIVRGLASILLAYSAEDSESRGFLCEQDISHCTCEIDRATNKAMCYNHTLLERLPERIDSNVQVIFCSSNISLQTTLLFTHRHGISITSFSVEQTVITCNKNAGIVFAECSNISVSNVILKGCGLQYINNTRGGLYIVKCINVRLVNVSVDGSDGTGMIMRDNCGQIDILDCTFENNRITTEADAVSGGGGVFLDVSETPEPSLTFHDCFSFQKNNNFCDSRAECQCSAYNFVDCSFSYNNASYSAFKNRHGQHMHLKNLTNLAIRLERGGGLSIAIRKRTRCNTIKICNANFYKNSAEWGGGLYVVYHKTPENNTVEINDSVFTENHCNTDKGGGGASIGFGFFRDNPPHHNKIVFNNCRFHKNHANFGGGLAIYSSRNSQDIKDNEFQFLNCSWESNRGQYGSAVTVLPQIWDAVKDGFLPTAIFISCTFKSNIIQNTVWENGTYRFNQIGKGTFLVSRFTVHFQGFTEFSGSDSSALYVTSGNVRFTEGSEVYFSNNSALSGGAISMHGFSTLYVIDNSTITFEGNKATSKGGAIHYYSFNKQDYNKQSQSCFIQYEGEKSIEQRKVMFKFKENKAGNIGHSIFATNLIPCQNKCNLFSLKLGSNYSFCELKEKRLEPKDIFSCIGTFEFENKTYEVATSGERFCSYDNTKGLSTTKDNISKPLKVIPGKEVRVPIRIYDDLHQNISYRTVYHVSVENKKVDIYVDKQYIYTYKSKIKLYGNPGEKTRVKIATFSIREVAVSFEVEMQQCPPGFVIHGTRKERRCVCSANTVNETLKSYMGIYTCNMIEFRAIILRGFWLGYDDEKIATENNLLSAYCPKTFCFSSESKQDNQYMLTSTASVTDLDRLVCGPNRTGRLCGSCRDNYSLYYHSNSYHCYEDHNCQWGFLLYILSEILPVSILFIIVIVFNIPFTSGAVNGALFFFQVVNTMQKSANGFVHNPNKVYHSFLTKAYDLIFRPFNLNFFTTDDLSFCLWKGARVLDMIAFKYVTIVYSLLLVVVTVAVIQIFNYPRVLFYFRCKGRSANRPNVQSSIIHGLSAFFVMTYSQCTLVSLLLLTPGHMRPMTTHNESFGKIRVVFYDGDLEFLRGSHLKYAIPAMFFTLIFILIPPILLIIYPLCYRIFGLLRIEETRCVQITCRIIPLERLKPLFDSFQGCFKDEYRFFAGLYFLYRLVALAGFAFSTSLTKFYTILEVLLICMLTFHSIVQPYKKRWHNIMDAFLFCNLAVINRLTLFNYTRASVRHDYQQEINIATFIQACLISLPLVYITFYAIAQTVLKMKRCVHCHKEPRRKDQSSEEHHNLTEMTEHT